MVAAKPYSAACARNSEPILAVLRRHCGDRRRLLEIGSGSGQHAAYFAAALPHLLWQTSDLPEHHAGIRAWLDEAGLENALPPLPLDVAGGQWPAGPFDAVFSANTLHIMAWTEVEALFARLPEVVSAHALLIIYGPFNYRGRYTSDSNEAFDASLRARAPHMGLRAFEAVDALAVEAGFTLLEDAAMPANNRCLVWRRGAGAMEG